ncbi:MAG: UDP-glucose 4-epimerase GalE [Clostridiales bacterium]|jgi:UDP-glucose 4-epimerase|nr:UDP-glucose 4-epimerase GalE [Clostridiales bacterium]
MKVLVCGGAGYVGSHTARELSDRGREVAVFDNLEKGHMSAVPKGAEFYRGDLRDYAAIDRAIAAARPDAVIDFAAYSLVGESVGEPIKYFENNIGGTLNLLKAMISRGVGHIVFSSTAAAYGEPESVPITEDARTLPTNPYGESKLCVEKMLKWIDRAHGLRYSVLRYFNVAGAHVSGEIGEDHEPETHLIPIVLRAALNRAESVTVYGGDYDTPDGTCVRDYIHVTDLADAHILALEDIRKRGVSTTYNLGNGKGFSVLEILGAARKVTGVDIKAVTGPRRAGDPSSLVASSDRIIRELGWQPKLFSLEKIIETAWNWHKNNPDGFKD